MGPDEVFGAKEVGRVSSFFDTMSLVLDFVPLIIAVFFDWKRTMKHVSPFPLFSGTIVNVLLVYHIMFVVDTEKHKATLYVATVGLVMGSVYVFLVGVRDSASGDKWSGIFWRVSPLLFMCMSGAWLIHLIDTGVTYDMRYRQSPSMYVFTVLVVLASNVIPTIGPLRCIKNNSFDGEVLQGIGIFVSLMTGVDSCYFVIYAVVLCEMGSLLMVVSGINALGAIALFVILLIQKDKHTKFNNARRVHRA